MGWPEHIPVGRSFNDWVWSLLVREDSSLWKDVVHTVLIKFYATSPIRQETASGELGWKSTRGPREHFLIVSITSGMRWRVLLRGCFVREQLPFLS